MDCLINNVDWKNNPTKFTYKLSETTEEKTATLETASEFGSELLFLQTLVKGKATLFSYEEKSLCVSFSRQTAEKLNNSFTSPIW